MVFQYVKEGPKTGLEKKYDQVKTANSNVEPNISQLDESRNNQALDLNLKPNKYFLEAHKARNLEEMKKQEKENYLQSIDEEGNRIQKIYNTDGFKAVHDPLNLWTKMSPTKLAWKVFYDVEDRDVFLKTLYYPNLKSDDYSNLTSKFSEEYSSLLTKRKLSFFTSLILGSAGLGVCYRFSLKSRTSAFIFLFAFGASFYQLNSMLKSGMKNRLNNYARGVAQSYDEIKYSTVEYGKVNI